jgi:hypothetical protein
LKSTLTTRRVAKAEAEAYFAEADVPTTLLRTSFFWENLLGPMAPKRGQDGRLGLALAMGDSALAGIAAEDHRQDRVRQLAYHAYLWQVLVATEALLLYVADQITVAAARSPPASPSRGSRSSSETHSCKVTPSGPSLPFSAMSEVERRVAP